MKTKFEMYKPRRIEYQKLASITDWKVKVYSITNRPEFQSFQILESAIEELPKWLEAANRSKLPVYKIAFLIVHEAREGVWLLLSWWTGGEMIETNVYFAEYGQPAVLKKTPYTSGLVCVWELEIWAHERKAWIQHVLLQANKPDFNNYLNDILK